MLGLEALRRVVFLVESPLTQRDYERFGFEVLQHGGLQVEAWEIGEIYLPRPGAEFAPRAEKAFIHPYRRERELVRALEALQRDTCVIALAGPYQGQEWTHAPILRALARSRCVYTTICSGHRPPERDVVPPDLGQTILRLSTRFWAHVASPFTSPRRGFKLTARRMRGRVHMAGLRIGPPPIPRPLDFVWAGTRVDQLSPTVIGAGTRVRYIHTLDYDNILGVSNIQQGPGLTALYIDTMGAVHPDFLVSDVPVLVDPQAWFAEVREALSGFEAATGRSVAIAPHPRSDPTHVRQWYGGRPVISTPTAEAVAAADVVLVTSASTSIGIAAAFATPVIAIRTPAIHATHLAQLDQYAQLLGLETFDTTDPTSTWPPPRINVDLYRAFVEDNVKLPGTAEKPFWSQVLDDLLHVRDHS
jgi:hypothetical protein